MLNTEKIRWMTKASAYETKEERGVFRASRFFRGDYVCYGMIKSAITLTITALCVLAIWIFINAEMLLTTKTHEDLMALAFQVLRYYGVGMVIFMILSFFIYQIKYVKVQKSLRSYMDCLKQVKKLQDGEKRSHKTSEEE